MDPCSACVTGPSFSVPCTEPMGCLVGAQHCGACFRQSEEEASDLWHVRFGRANPKVKCVQPHRLSQPGRTERRETLGSTSGVTGNVWHPTLHPGEINDMPSPQCYLSTLGWSRAGDMMPSGLVATSGSC